MIEPRQSQPAASRSATRDPAAAPSVGGPEMPRAKLVAIIAAAATALIGAPLRVLSIVPLDLSPVRRVQRWVQHGRKQVFESHRLPRSDRHRPRAR